MKKCRRCKEVKGLENFSKDLTQADGKNALCRKCLSDIYKLKKKKKLKKSLDDYKHYSNYFSHKNHGGGIY